MLEIAVGVAIAVALGLATLGVLRPMLAMSASARTASGGSLTLQAVTDDLQSDAETAFGVYVPAEDVMHRPNAGTGGAHEIDFYTRTNSGTIASWAYYYDAVAQTLRRFDFDAAGHAGEADRASGTIDTRARYPALTGVTAFDATTIQQTKSWPVECVRGCDRAAVRRSHAESTPMGFDAGGRPRRDLFGGNATVQVAIATAHGSQTFHLTSAAMPSGFTVRASRSFARSSIAWIKRTAFCSDSLGNRTFSSGRDSTSVTTVGERSHRRRGATSTSTAIRRTHRRPAEDYHPEWYTESTAGHRVRRHARRDAGSYVPRRPATATITHGVGLASPCSRRSFPPRSSSPWRWHSSEVRSPMRRSHRSMSRRGSCRPHSREERPIS